MCPSLGGFSGTPRGAESPISATNVLSCRDEVRHPLKQESELGALRAAHSPSGAIAGRAESAVRPQGRPGSTSLSVISPAPGLRAPTRRSARQSLFTG
jgi:hypothetical protein